MSRSIPRLLPFFAAACLTACATASPPEALSEARAAYRAAADSAAPSKAPDQLREAWTALREAEASFADEGPSHRTRQLAELAQQRAQVARYAAEIGVESDRTLQAVERSEALIEAIRAAKASALRAAARDPEAAPRTRRVQAEEAAPTVSIEDAADIIDTSRGTLLRMGAAASFASGKAQLTPAALADLAVIAGYLLERPGRAILVEGHSDDHGTTWQNLEVAMRRATTVKDALVDFGVPPARVTAVTRGASAPIAGNLTAEGRALNRRVDIILLK